MVTLVLVRNTGIYALLTGWRKRCKGIRENSNQPREKICPVADEHREIFTVTIGLFPDEEFANFRQKLGQAYPLVCLTLTHIDSEC
jgi:hypothetical protein